VVSGAPRLMDLLSRQEKAAQAVALEFPIKVKRSGAVFEHPPYAISEAVEFVRVHELRPRERQHPNVCHGELYLAF